jgi:hypothetical protein
LWWSFDLPGRLQYLPGLWLYQMRIERERNVF